MDGWAKGVEVVCGLCVLGGLAIGAVAGLRALRFAWRQQVLAYFATSGVSNGRTEAVHLLIEKIRRLAHGFCNFSNYRILLVADATRPYRPRPKLRLETKTHFGVPSQQLHSSQPQYVVSPPQNRPILGVGSCLNTGPVGGLERNWSIESAGCKLGYVLAPQIGVKSRTTGGARTSPSRVGSVARTAVCPLQSQPSPSDAGRLLRSSVSR